jgi:hypothetical protein
MIDPLIVLILSASLALLFYMAARHKMSAPGQFKAQLAAYELVPEFMLPAVAKILPYIEMAVVFLILVPFSRPVAAVVAATLLTVYALSMAVNMLRGRADIDCGCGGQPQLLSSWLLLRNGVLVAGCCLLLAPVSERAMTWADGSFLVLMTAVLAMVYLLVEQLVRNQSFSDDRGASHG